MRIRGGRVRRSLVALACASAGLCLVPSTSLAQTDGNACAGKLTGAGRQAELSFTCSFGVSGLEIFSNKDATISGDIKGEEGKGHEGFVCVQPILKGPFGQQGGDSFGEEPAVCEGQLSAGNTATGTLVARDDVCDPLALRVGAFSFGAAEDEFIVRIQGCRGADGSNCTRRGTSGNDILRGTSRGDVICAGGGNDIVYAEGGRDTIYGRGGDDILRGQGGNDRLYGGDGRDVVYGNSGADRLFGEGGGDILKLVDHVEGNDFGDGGADSDLCSGDRGDARRGCP